MRGHRRSSFVCCRVLSMALCKPKMLLLMALIICWQSKSVSVADNHHKNLRLRAPSYLNQQFLPAIPSTTKADPIPGPFFGNAIAESGQEAFLPKSKKECRTGRASIVARNLIGPALKRSYFATTKEEVEERIKDQEQQDARAKRDLQRVEGTTDATLPWTCETNYEWRDMGADHYPRFVRTAECLTQNCFNGFFRCRPRRYKTKVLKRVTPSDSTSCEDDDVSLPETLRSNWRFITVTISLCCDCVGRIPGATEV